MKKMIFAVALAALSLGMTSCNDDKESTSILTLPMPAYNLVTSLDGNSCATSLCYYTVTMTYPGNLMTLASEQVKTTGTSTLYFATGKLTPKVEQAQVDGTSRETLSFSALNASEAGSAVTNLDGVLTQAVYLPKVNEVPGYEVLVPVSSGHYLFTQYNIDGKWKISTFWPDLTYKGSTTTRFPGQTEPFVTEGISYRLVMKRNLDNSITDKADIIFYDAQFAPQAPALKAVVLKDLKLEFTSRGFHVSGTNVVPKVLMDGNVPTDNARFTFDRFEMNSAGLLTGAAIDYSVAGKYSGTFSGSCVAK